MVVGWSDPERSRPYLGSLLLGYYDDAGKLIYACRAGSGISDAELERLWRRPQPLAIKKNHAIESRDPFFRTDPGARCGGEAFRYRVI